MAPSRAPGKDRERNQRPVPPFNLGGRGHRLDHMPNLLKGRDPRRAGQCEATASISRHVCFWHLADNPTTPVFVRFQSKADKANFGQGRLVRC